MNKSFNLKTDAGFTEVESYIKKQLITFAIVEVDFYLAKGDTYTFNVCIGGVNALSHNVVRLTSRSFKGEVYESFVFNIIIRSDLVIDISLITSLLAYSKIIEAYVDTRDYEEDFKEWRRYDGPPF